MLFNSYEFLIYFLPLFFIVYYIVKPQYRNVVLLLGSLLFYSFGDIRYIPVLIFSIIFNFLCSRYVVPKNGDLDEKHKWRRLTLISVIAVNLLVLSAFKLFATQMGLPIGMSFYTFQIISYLVDVYHGAVCREKSFIYFATYVTMFPKLQSGPITGYAEVRGDLSKRKCSLERFQEGLSVFIIGLAFKVLLADRVGLLWNYINNIGYVSLSVPLAWLGAVVYSFKLYFDFYGYSVMAVGLGSMLGFKLPYNFKNPYMATGVRDFYRRWHITLGRFFRNYVYIPLGGSRKGRLATALNLLAVWMLTALWHGITLNFFVWGGIIWLCIIIERMLGKVEILNKYNFLKHIYVWLIIPVTWICFEISDMGELGTYLGRMFGVVDGINVRAGDYISIIKEHWSLLLICMISCTPVLKNIYEKIKGSFVVKIILAALFWVCVRRIVTEGNNIFMYFNY